MSRQRVQLMVGSPSCFMAFRSFGSGGVIRSAPEVSAYHLDRVADCHPACGRLWGSHISAGWPRLGRHSRVVASFAVAGSDQPHGDPERTSSGYPLGLCAPSSHASSARLLYRGVSISVAPGGWPTLGRLHGFASGPTLDQPARGFQRIGPRPLPECVVPAWRAQGHAELVSCPPIEAGPRARSNSRSDPHRLGPKGPSAEPPFGDREPSAVRARNA
jgi:hypothetical protein